MQEIKISNGYVQLWASYLRSQQIEPIEAEFLQHLRPQLIHLIDQPFDTQVPLELLNQIVQDTQDYLKSPQLIFDMVQVIRPEHFGLLGYMASKSSNLSEIIDYIMRFQRLVIDGSEFVPLQLRQSEQGIELYWAYLDDKYNVLNELTMAAMLQLARSILLEQQLQLKTVYFAHAPSVAPQHFYKFFATEVLFSQPYYGFSLDLTGLYLQSEQADPILLKLLLQQAEQAIAVKPMLDDIVFQARNLIAEHLRTTQRAIKIEQLAQQLHMSIRTLQRNLEQEDTSFKKLLEQERIKRCEQLLEQNYSFVEIAELLDYSDQSALARAYKAATGMTLLARKKQMKQP
ncbi:AraC family transcriptional regulator [Acinetobacter sp. NCu2D-2]|uniref:AraC family transcriptional regulator n=1 Tax=Acinetobacter sp. NCu2D-2 TaxID=1608473 RepID=UPI0007CDD440|nr:AraC family transcriptional regulator [Acinetobacter sp. NCu2D-2]ANF81112.1 AraC family transcriptional regulator [Acinetobacter sp. NCu2D-2]